MPVAPPRSTLHYGEQDMAETAFDDPDLNTIADKLAIHFREGGTIGDLHGFDEKDYEAMYAVGHGLYTQGRHRDAAKVFGFLMTNNPYDRRFPLAMGATQQMLGKHAEAAGFYGLAVVLDMSDPVPLFHMAECMAALGQIDEAREAFQHAQEFATKPEHQPIREKAAVQLKLLEQSATKREG